MHSSEQYPGVMSDIRRSVVITMADSPEVVATADYFFSYFTGSGLSVELRWVEEALSQLLWVDVLVRNDMVYMKGPNFKRYLKECGNVG